MRITPKVRKIALLSATAAALVAATSMLASAQPGPGCANMGPGHAGMGPGGRHMRGCGPMMRDRVFQSLEKLELTDQQRDKLHQIRRSAPGVLMPKRQAVMEARMDLADLMARKDADPKDLRKAHDQMLRARDALQAAAFDLRLQAREVLTPEQREKLHKALGSGGPQLRGMQGHGRCGQAPGDGETGDGPDDAFDFGWGGEGF